MPCDRLFQYHDEKTITLQAIVKNEEAQKDFYTLNTNKRRGGVVMSFCPFCGEDIGSHIK